jgi:hypothetical protein
MQDLPGSQVGQGISAKLLAVPNNMAANIIKRASFFISLSSVRSAQGDSREKQGLKHKTGVRFTKSEQNLC